MRLKPFFYLLFIVLIAGTLSIAGSGCGQIGFPTGGAKDSIPPRLVNASPALQSTNISSNKITLTFNEYVEIKEAQTNVLISPFPKKTPSVDYKLKTVTVKLKDTLMPNTTYSINFGNAIVDINEGNPLKDFTYVFSTGNSIDSFMLTGKVIIAESGNTDSTLLALLYRNADDSAVIKRKPDYIARLQGDGSFLFVNLPAGNFKLYALKDGDGSKTYNAKKELFAFADSDVTISEKTETAILFASALEKESGPTKTSVAGPAKKLNLIYPPGMQSQDLLTPFQLSFNNPLQTFEPAKLILTDTNYKPIPATSWSIDSTRTKISLAVNWQEEMQYRLIVDTTAVSDSAGNQLTKLDTIKFKTKAQADYANIVLRFSNIELNQNPVLQFLQGEEIKESHPLTTLEWRKKMMNPGQYTIRILFDDNKNGSWDPGDYSKKLQPEKAITLKDKLSLRANWDNERDIKL